MSFNVDAIIQSMKDDVAAQDARDVEFVAYCARKTEFWTLVNRTSEQFYARKWDEVRVSLPLINEMKAKLISRDELEYDHPHFNSLKVLKLVSVEQVQTAQRV